MTDVFHIKKFFFSLLFFCFLLLFLLLFLNPVSVSADTDTVENNPDKIILSETSGTVEAYPEQAIALPFQTSSGGSIQVHVETMTPAAFSAIVTDSSGNAVTTNYQLSVDSSYWTKDELWHCVFETTEILNPGSYQVQLMFSDVIECSITLSQTPQVVGISQTKLVLTTGFSKTLSVTSTSGLITWSSDNTKIATVTTNGKVTAKKTGSCNITAVTDEGSFSCKVIVKENVYKETRITLEHVSSGSACVQVYKAYFDNKGNIKIILAVANNNEYNIESLKKIKVILKNPDGKKIASYTLKNKKITVKKKEIKNTSFLIPKKNVLLKKADLRSAFSSISGKYGYTKTLHFHKKK